MKSATNGVSSALRRSKNSGAMTISLQRFRPSMRLNGGKHKAKSMPLPRVAGFDCQCGKAVDQGVRKLQWRLQRTGLITSRLILSIVRIQQQRRLTWPKARRALIVKSGSRRRRPIQKVLQRYRPRHQLWPRPVRLVASPAGNSLANDATNPSPVHVASAEPLDFNATCVVRCVTGQQPAVALFWYPFDRTSVAASLLSL